MPYIIKNISRTNKRFKEPVPITLEFKDDYGSMIKHTIQPDDSIILYFIPTTAKIMHINNMISIDHISSNDVKLFSIKSENTNNIVNDTVSDGVNEGVNEGVNDIGIDIIIDDNGISEDNNLENYNLEDYNLEDSTKTKRKKT
jgi:hypothetical protein